jgi:REP element-mobilizing transposase RayT
VPRQARQVSETGLYHIVFRGVNHCQLFEEQEDYERLLGLLDKVRTELGLEVIAYCLMSNHVHILVRENSPGEVVLAMRKILSPYAGWFNQKYERSGALIANRYKSEPVTKDSYLLALVRYSHHNPVKAGLALNADLYPWSSYRCYTTSRSSIVNVDLVLGMLSANRGIAIQQFRRLHLPDNPETHVNTFAPARRKDSELRVMLAQQYDQLQASAVVGLPKTQRDSVLDFLRTQGFTIRQIERVTGVSRGIITRRKPPN